MSLRTACMTVGVRGSPTYDPLSAPVSRQARPQCAHADLLDASRARLKEIDGKARDGADAGDQSALVDEEARRVVRRHLCRVGPPGGDAEEKKQPRHFLLVEREIFRGRRLL